MKLYSLTDTILTLASAVPNRGTQFCGDVYHIGEIADAFYPAFVLTNREVYQNRDEYYEDHHIIMFEFDRLTESQDNNLDIQSHSIQTLKVIVDKLEELGCIISVAQYTPFVQRFSDMCGGAFADVRLRIPIDDCYEYSFDLGDLIDLKDLYVNKNGNYIAAPNTAYKSVVVNVEGGGTDYNHYHEDVDDETNAQIKVNNNIIQVSRDGIEIYDKDNKGRINVDYDGVNVYGSALTFNDARVLTTNDLDNVNGDISEINEQINTINGEIENLNPLVLDNYYTKDEVFDKGETLDIIHAEFDFCPDPDWQINTLYPQFEEYNTLHYIPRSTRFMHIPDAKYTDWLYGLKGVYYFKNDSNEPKGLRVSLGSSAESYWYTGVVYWNDIEYDIITANGEGWSGSEETTRVFPPYFEGWIRIYGDDFEVENITVQQYNVVK